MPRDPIPWTRYWHPREQPPFLSSGGFLVRPEDAPFPGSEPDLRTLQELTEHPCLALLGPAGMGKTYAIEQAIQERQNENNQPISATAYRDLRPMTGAQLLRFLEGGEAIQEWKDGSRLHLYLDNVDNYRHGVPALAPLLRSMVDSQEAERLHLRLACRTGEWSPSLESTLTTMFDEVSVRGLAPLSQEDVRLAAADRDLDGEEFLQTVQTSGVQPLAARPITLFMLLEVFEETGGLPESAPTLYQRGCHHLCERVGNRAERDETTTSTEGRLSTARRLAAMTLLCHRTGISTAARPEPAPDGTLRVQDVAGGSEPIESGTVDIDQDAIMDTLSTGLFMDSGPSLIEWEHLSYAEHLAAEYLIENNFDARQIEHMLFREAPGQRRVTPPLRSVAAWLASMDESILQTLIETDPEALLDTDLSPLSSDEKRELVGRLISMVEEGRLDTRQFDTYGGLDRLSHGGLEDQLRDVLSDPQRDPGTRAFAVRIAAACETRGLEPDLLALVFDDDEPTPVRMSSAAAVAYRGSSQARSQLEPLLDWGPERDPDDRFKGFALTALWPEHIELEEVLDNLRPPRNPNLAGAYQAFVSGFPETLSAEDLPAVIQWVRDQGFDRRDTGVLVQLADRIVVEAAQQTDQQLIRSELAELASERLRQNRPLVHRKSKELITAWEGNEQARRQLVHEVLPGLEEPDRPHIILSVNPPLIVNEDFEWLIEACENEEDPAIKRGFAELLLSLNDQSPAHTRMLYRLAENDEIADEVLGPLFDAVELGSEEAEEMRSRYEERQELMSRTEEETLDPPLSEVLSECLERFEEGDLDAWWDFCRKLQFDSKGKHGNCTYNPDIQEYPGWELLTEEQRDRSPQLCHRYVHDKELDVEQPYRDVQTKRHALSAYRALHHLAVEAPDLLDSLEMDPWERWTPIILDFPFGSMQDSSGTQAILLDRAFRAAPDAVVEGVRILLPKEGGEDEPSWNPRILEPILQGGVTDALLAGLRDGALSAQRNHVIASMLLSAGSEEAEHFIEEQVSRIPDEEERNDWIALALALVQEKEEGWHLAWQVLRDNEGLADLFFKGLLDELSFAHGGPELELDANQWAELYRWLLEHYPPDEDPEMESGFGVNYRWSLAQWRNRIPRKIADLSTPESVGVLHQLSEDLPEQRYLRRLARKAQETAIETSWTPPSPTELRELAADSRKRLVDDPDELMDVVLETIDRLQVRLQDQDTRAARDLWDHQYENDSERPVQEPALSDWVKRGLERELDEQQVILNREAEVERDGDTDIKVETAGTEDIPPMVVIVEVKGPWNQDLETAMEDQLLDQYMRGHGCQHGIYLVGWFNQEPWDDEDYRKPRAHRRTRSSLEETLFDESEALSDGVYTVEARILDCSLAP